MSDQNKTAAVETEVEELVAPVLPTFKSFRTFLGENPASTMRLAK